MDAILQMVKQIALSEAVDAGQFTLGQLIDKLAECDADAVCDLDTGDGPSTSLTSYRGHYDHLAIEPDQQETAVGVVLHCLREAVGSVHEGYKGGRYTMTADVPVWVAHWGDCGRRIVGVKNDGARVVIETAE